MFKDREDYNSPEYKSWRYRCLSRDKFTCALTGVKGGDLEVHHIVPWAKAPNLRYAVSNGITLSKEMHDMVTGREEEFEERFKKMVAEKSKKIKRYYDMKEQKWKPRNPKLRY